MTFLSSAVIPLLRTPSAVAAIAIVVRSPTLSMKGPYPFRAPDSAVRAGTSTYGNIALKTGHIRLLAFANIKWKESRKLDRRVSCTAAIALHNGY